MTQPIPSPGNQPLPLPVTGQPRTLTAHATADADGVMVHLADPANPELKALVRLDQDALNRLVRDMVQTQIAVATGRWLLDEANALVHSQPEVSHKRRCGRCGTVNDVTAGPTECLRCGQYLTP